jgi:hypothetical protein
VSVAEISPTFATTYPCATLALGREGSCSVV